MNLYAKLLEREAAGRPVTVGLIGAGKFGTMFLTQVRRTPGMHLVGLADLNVARARSQLKTAGWDEGAYAASSLGDAFKTRKTYVAARCRGADCISRHRRDRGGDRRSEVRHSLRARIDRARQAIVMVNVEADALAGPLARAQGASRGRRLLASPGAISRR